MYLQMRQTPTARDGISGDDGHAHVFLGVDHERSERMTWAVIALCCAMMAAEIVGGLLFGSIALVADGLHMSTHAGALLLAALAYGFARKHAHDSRFTFGTGKFGDLAGFTSAIVLAMIALLIGYESVVRMFAPISIRFAEAIPIACLGLAVNIVSAWLLSRGGHHHHHGHDHADSVEEHRIEVDGKTMVLSVYEEGVPPRFRLAVDAGRLDPRNTVITTVRADGARQVFAMADAGDYLESLEEIPEPHAFTVYIGPAHQGAPAVIFEEHHHAAHNAHRDNNMRAAVVHVAADAAVSVLVIVGLVLARAFGWLWMDPLAGIAGACVIAAWSYGLLRDTGAILLDMNPDRLLAANLRKTLERDGDRLADLHLWRVGPGHLAAIMSIATNQPHPPQYYRDKLAAFRALSHVTVEVVPRAVPGSARRSTAAEE
jgi:cation diffusion facilitator family transporter